MTLKPIEELNLSSVVSLVGAGGKSTLMYYFAKKLAGQGKQVLVTTTTHIFRPNPCYFASTKEEIHHLWGDGKFAVIGTPSSKEGKLEKPDMDFLYQMIKEADVVLVEADGARHFLIKVPRQQEPVLLPETQQVIAVMGLSAVGQPLHQCCFGLEKAMALLGAGRDHILTAEDAVTLLSSEYGGRKYVGNRRFSIVLNQCDDEHQKEMAEVIAFQLCSLGMEEVYVCSFSHSQQKFYNLLAGAGEIEAKIWKN